MSKSCLNIAESKSPTVLRLVAYTIEEMFLEICFQDIGTVLCLLYVIVLFKKYTHKYIYIYTYTHAHTYIYILPVSLYIYTHMYLV